MGSLLLRWHSALCWGSQHPLVGGRERESKPHSGAGTSNTSMSPYSDTHHFTCGTKRQMLFSYVEVMFCHITVSINILQGLSNVCGYE